MLRALINYWLKNHPKLNKIYECGLDDNLLAIFTIDSEYSFSLAFIREDSVYLRMGAIPCIDYSPGYLSVADPEFFTKLERYLIWFDHIRSSTAGRGPQLL